MPKIKLTDTSIRRLPAPDPSGKQTLYWDTEQRGFGVLVSGKTNSKSYVVQREVKGTGKTRRVTLGSVGEFEAAGRSVEDARDQAAKMVLGMREGIDPKARREPEAKANMTLQQILDTYLENQTLAAASRKLYRHHIETQLSDWLDRPLREITPEMVTNRFRKIKETVARKGKNAYHASEPGAATANVTMRALRTLWNYAKDTEGVPDLPAHNPVKLEKRWYPIPSREHYISGDKLPAFYQAVCSIENTIIRDYVLLVLFTGMRRDEAASLRWTDVDFAQRFIRLPAWRTKTRNALDLPMSDFVHSLLVARRAIGIENGFVFPATSKSRHLESPKEALRVACKPCGIHVSIHDLRRTFVTVAARCNIPSMALSGLVNHSVGKGMTAGYAQLHGADLVEPMQVVTDRLKALCQIAQLPTGIVSLPARRKHTAV